MALSTADGVLFLQPTNDLFESPLHVAIERDLEFNPYAFRMGNCALRLPNDDSAAANGFVKNLKIEQNNLVGAQALADFQKASTHRKIEDLTLHWPLRLVSTANDGDYRES